MGLKEQILAASDLKQEKVEMPEWGCTVYVRAMSAAERLVFVEKSGNTGIRLCAQCLCDEQGNRLFTDEEAVELGKKSFDAIERICGIAMKLNGLGADAVESAAKN